MSDPRTPSLGFTKYTDGVVDRRVCNTCGAASMDAMAGLVICHKDWCVPMRSLLERIAALEGKVRT